MLNIISLRFPPHNMRKNTHLFLLVLITCNILQPQHVLKILKVGYRQLCCTHKTHMHHPMKIHGSKLRTL